mgnify:CR=1 FL=1
MKRYKKAMIHWFYRPFSGKFGRERLYNQIFFVFHYLFVLQLICYF